MTEQFHTLKFNSMSGAPAAGLLKDLPLRAVIKLDNGKYLTCQDLHFITRRCACIFCCFDFVHRSVTCRYAHCCMARYRKDRTSVIFKMKNSRNDFFNPED